jgi:pyridoxal phosphate enzyme (YggS family)
VHTPVSEQMLIQDSYHQIQEKIIKSARNAGRNPDEIRLVVVTKTQPLDTINMLIEAGAKDFGENYIEEAIPKIQALSMDNNLLWHMIGHVQSRKALGVCEHFQFLHSLDNVKLAERLNRSLLEMGKLLPVWLEFNVSGEGTKFGWDISAKENWVKILPDIENILALPKLIFLKHHDLIIGNLENFRDLLLIIFN